MDNCYLFFVTKYTEQDAERQYYSALAWKAWNWFWETVEINRPIPRENMRKTEVSADLIASLTGDVELFREPNFLFIYGMVGKHE